MRATLDRLIRERGADYASLSRLIGRNPAYVQQFIRKGSPRRLAEADRAVLARFFGVDERLLGAPRDPDRDGASWVKVPRLGLDASAGPGAFAGPESVRDHFGFDAAWLRRLAGPARRLSIIQVMGDSMAPTLNAGDDILVNHDDGASRLRDGIYVLREGEMLHVKRIAVDDSPVGFGVTSDNAAFLPGANPDPAQVEIVGRVIWVGRRLA